MKTGLLIRPSVAFLVAGLLALGLLALLAFPTSAQQSVSFSTGPLAGTDTLQKPTSLQFGPDGRLYVAQQNGLIRAYTVQRNGPSDYAVTNTETITQIRSMPNHNDDGTVNTTITSRQVTGLLVRGTAEQPVIYVSSSDFRIGGTKADGTGDGDTGLDTNSGVVSRLTKTATGWNKVDLVRGLPRSEENHSPNGMQLDESTNTLYLAVGGNTNHGAPSNNFALLPEVALSAAILSIDLDAIGNSTYDLPTLDDPARAGTADANDPFGGNDGKNQARLVSGGPVQVYASGFRNPYDLLITQSAKMYTSDNSGNAGWGDVPVNEGPAGNCTNEVNEPGTTDTDTLHLIEGAGYYGGHPNPTRGNIANTFAGQSPVPQANPIECDYRAPGAEKGNLAEFTASTNGLAEYTASDFGGAMQGNLLAASFDGTIYRLQLNATGDAVTSKEALFTNFGTQPLDVTTQGDADPFPGTVWAAVYGSWDIQVFEPEEGGTGCAGTDDPALDEDADGFDNADEIDNATNPCSAASVPADADGDKDSNLNDPDDDNDGTPDTSDPFAVDPNDGTTTNLPVSYTWDNDAANPGGLLNLGFTGLMTNKTADYMSLYDPANMTAGGAAGVTTVDKVPDGDAYTTRNTQKYGFQFGVNTSSTSKPFTAHTRILAPFAGITPENNQSMGLFIGTGDQDNYLKLTTHANAGNGGIEFAKEVSGTFAKRPKAAVAMPGPDAVELFLTVDPVANTVQPSYQVITNGAAGPRKTLGGPEPIPAAWLDGPNALAVGIISTSAGPGPVFPATWELIEVVPEAASGASTSQAHFSISPPSTGIDASTFGAGSFKIKNNSPDGQKIKSLRVDLGSSLLSDLVFDPEGTAGDVGGAEKCLSPDVGATSTGYVAPAACTAQFGEPHDGGYDTVTLAFNDFDPGEEFHFSADVDPTSIKGVAAPGPSKAGNVSGLELTKAEATVEFDDSSTQVAQTFRTGSSKSASQNTLKTAPPEKPGIQVVGVSAPATVSAAQQTVRVSGPVGSTATLLRVEGGLFLNGVPNGGFDVDPYEANKALAVASPQTKQIGSSGTVDFPITLTRSSDQGGLNYIAATIKEDSGRTGPVSDVLVLKLQNTPLN